MTQWAAAIWDNDNISRNKVLTLHWGGTGTKQSLCLNDTLYEWHILNTCTYNQLKSIFFSFSHILLIYRNSSFANWGDIASYFKGVGKTDGQLLSLYQFGIVASLSCKSIYFHLAISESNLDQHRTSNIRTILFKQSREDNWILR